MGERGLDREPATDDDIAAMVDDRRRGHRARRARVLDVAHAAAPCPRRATRSRAPGPSRRSSSRSPTCSAGTVGARSRSRPASASATPTPSRARAPRWRGWPRSTAGRAARSPSDSRTASAVPTCTPGCSTSSTKRRPTGGVLRPQTTARGIGLLFGIAHRTLFDGCPSWRALRELPLDGRLAALDDPESRARLIADADAQPPGLDMNLVFVLGTDGDASLRLLPRRQPRGPRGSRRTRPRRRRSCGCHARRAAARSSTSRSSTRRWTRSERCSTTRRS